MSVFGERLRAKPQPKALDLDGFRAAAEKAMRAIRSGIDTGESYDELVSDVQRTLDQLRELEMADTLTRERADELGDIFHKMALAKLVPLLNAAFPLLDAADAMARPEFLKVMRRKEVGRVPTDQRAYLTGDVLAYGEAGFGKFVVGGFGDNTYDCTRFAVIVDLGGNDTYNGPAGGTFSRDRRLGLVVDVDGDDTYDALNDGLGSATYGVGVLVDHAGNDTYKGKARCAGFGAAGVGIFVDHAGDDTYEFERHSGGVGVGGVGVFADLHGNDSYRSNTQSFGLGLPAGVGLHVDGAGDDTVQIGQDKGAPARSLSLGSGVGLGGLVAGGVGMFLDRSGDDDRSSGGLSFGAAAHGGLGLYVDFLGGDRSKAGPGSLGASYGKGIGICVDARGDDQFSVEGGMGLGAAADGRAWFLDAAGDDDYTLSGVGFGHALPTGVAGFFDLGGADRYRRTEESLFPKVWTAADKPEGTWQVFLDEGEGDDVFDWEVPDGRKPVAGKSLTVDGDRLLVDTHPAKSGNDAPAKDDGK